MKQNKFINVARKIPFLYEPLADVKNYMRDGKVYERFLKDYIELSKRGVHVIYCEPPHAEKIKTLDAFEKKRLKEWIFDFNHIEQNIEVLKQLYGEDMSADYIYKLYEGIKVVPWGDGKRVCDYHNEYVNITEGIRYTTDVPQKYENSIHFYGACTARGTGVEDTNTIQSFLQRLLNKNEENSYRVVNHGIGCGSTLSDDLYAIEKTAFKQGDYAIILHQSNHTFINFCKKNGIPMIECSKFFNTEEKNGAWFIDDTLHTTEIGNEIIANGIMQELSSEWSDAPQKEASVIRLDASTDDSFAEEPELKKYLGKLEMERCEGYKDKKIGAIVMNCNPFTLGHRYLIETSAQKVEQLYIFVVEEDKSYFPFEDRIELVKKGVADLKNVHVLPSGQFIISALTFPGYFNKENDKEAIVDTSKDIDIFGKYIGPVLNISVRFAGEEPLDPITMQYNETMEERLPLYGIRFEVIKRKTIQDDSVISASAVRAALKEKNFKRVKQMVPETTYEYLIKRFGE